MERRGNAEEAPCPYLMPLAGRRAGGLPLPVPVYCRQPSGRVRVPSPDQLAWLCTAGQYHNCAGYRRWARCRTANGGDS